MPQTNPLFPTQDDQPEKTGFVLQHQNTHPQPEASPKDNGSTAAINLIREKLARIYAEEPSAKEEEQKAAIAKPRSKHQQFIYELNTSGKSLAEIQAAWHAYYASLPDTEKHEVWREFYETNTRAREPQPQAPVRSTEPQQPSRTASTTLSQAFNLQRSMPVQQPTAAETVIRRQPPDNRTIKELRQTIRHHVTAGGKLRAKHHLQSLGFGLAIGIITIVITLFGLFNEVVIAPFIQPGRASATPIIIDPNSVATSGTPEVIIPKINLEIPVDYSAPSNDEATIQNALENGVVHYPSTVMPGQNGNAAFFGHSSNNILNPGKYKFAFVLLHELVPGDTFYLTNNGKAYVYKVFLTKVVEPSQVDVLNNLPGHAATATLITCDPPGTALHRLVVVGDQISPDPSTNGNGNNTAATNAATVQLPDNGPSLWDRIWNSIF